MQIHLSVCLCFFYFFVLIGLLSITDILSTVNIINVGTNGSNQTVLTQIRLLQKEQSDLGLHCLPLHLQHLEALLHC